MVEWMNSHILLSIPRKWIMTQVNNFKFFSWPPKPSPEAQLFIFIWSKVKCGGDYIYTLYNWTKVKSNCKELNRKFAIGIFCSFYILHYVNLIIKSLFCQLNSDNWEIFLFYLHVKNKKNEKYNSNIILKKHYYWRQ